MHTCTWGGEWVQSECKSGVNAYIWAPNKCQRMHIWMQKGVENKKNEFGICGSVESKMRIDRASAL